MSEIFSAFAIAFDLIISFDRELYSIIERTLYVSITAVALAAFFGLLLGAVLAVYRFPGRRAVIVVLNALMGLPPVVVGLVLYLFLSREGPLGFMGLLFSPTAMVLAQFFLILPIIAAL